MTRSNSRLSALITSTKEKFDDSIKEKFGLFQLMKTLFVSRKMSKAQCIDLYRALYFFPIPITQKPFTYYGSSS